MNELEKAILDTLAYFDIFDYPMTEFEIWKFLYFDVKPDSEIRYAAVRDALLGSEGLKGKIGFKEGYYFLAERENIIGTKRDRYAYAERKFFKALRIAKLLRFFPFVKMIGVCNTLAFSNSRRQADIDFFIITKRRRVWQSRFWITGFLKIFRMRPSREKSRDTICASFFADEEHLNFQSLCFDKNDVYLKYWVRQLVPIYNEGIYGRFFKSNSWVDDNLPNMMEIKTPPRRRVKKLRLAKMLINFIFSFFPESIFKNYQMKIMPTGLKSLANKDTRVVVNDHMLKFHDNDRRHAFFERWTARKKKFV